MPYRQPAYESVEEVEIVAVQSFAYRSPRFALSLPLEFLVEGTSIPGRCRDLSEQGISVLLQQPVLPGTRGRVRLRIESCCVEVAAQVAYAELYEAGLHFTFGSLAEQAFVEMLVKVVARSAGRAKRLGKDQVPR